MEVVTVLAESPTARATVSAFIPSAYGARIRRSTAESPASASDGRSEALPGP